MSTPSSDGDENDKNASISKTAGFVVFSGIAMSILKALYPYNKKEENERNSSTESAQSVREPQLLSPQEPIIKPVREPQLLSPQEPIITKKSISCVDQNEPASLRTIEIVKGDTLWGLSRQYGVSIDAIKEANGLTGDVIYAGKKLVIP